MSTIALTLSVTTITVAEGRAALTASVTNSSPVPARIVLGAFGPPDGTAAGATAWTGIEQPVRDVDPGATVQYAVAFTPPAGTAAGSYPVRFIAYSADQAPEEYSDQARQVDVVVPAAPAAPPPKKPWWPWAVAAALVVIVGVVLFLVFRPRDTVPPPSPSATPTPASSTPTPESTPPGTPTPTVDQLAALTANAWVAVAVDDGTGLVATLTDTKPTAVFGTSGALSGSGGCNSYSATYNVSGDEVKIGNTVSTLIACVGGGVMEQEQRFFKALESARTFTLEPGALQLRKADGTTAALLVEAIPAPTDTFPIFTFHPDITLAPDVTLNPDITKLLPPDVIIKPPLNQP